MLNSLLGKGNDYALLKGVLPVSRRHGAAPRCPEEIELAIALTTTWMLATGRRLHQYPTLHGLDSDQLIDFWADAHTAPDETTHRKAQMSETTEDARS